MLARGGGGRWRLAAARHQALDRGKGKQLSKLHGLTELDHKEMRSEFKHRFLGLALEGYRRDEISGGKLRELVAMVGLSTDDLANSSATPASPTATPRCEHTSSRIVVTDANVLINLTHVSRLGLLARIPNDEFVVPQVR